MRIGFVIWSLATKGGIPRLGIDLAGEMSRRGHEVFIFSNDTADGKNSKPAYPVISDISICVLPLYSGKAAQDARTQIVSADLDVLCAMFSWNALLWFPWLLNETGIPLLISEHNHPEIIENERWNAYERIACMAGADGIHILNNSFLQFFPEFLHERITVIGNPAPQAKVVDWAKRENSPRKSLLAAGRFDDSHKNFSFLIKAFASLKDNFPDWDLHICGDGMDKARYENLIVGLRLSERVFLDGNINDMNSQYAASHLFCIPSRYEGFPLVVMEAQSHGLPVVGFAQCSGVNEIVIQGESGVLVEDMTPQALADGLSVLMANPAERHSMGARGQHLLARYGARAIYDKWEEMLLRTSGAKGKTRLNFVSPSREEISEIALREILCRKNPCLSPASEAIFRKLKAYNKSSVQTKKLSVIICCHNEEEFITECIASLRLGCNTSWEAIVVDDASTDSTRKILDVLSHEFHNLTCHYLEHNIGPGAARNFALTLAKGEYITFLDADDYVDADVLKRKVAEIEKSDVDILCSSHTRIYDKGNSYKYLHETKFSGKSAFNLYLMRKFRSWASWINIYKREHVVKNSCFFTTKFYYEDVSFCMRTFYTAQKIKTSPEPYYFYRCNNASLTRGKTGTALHLMSSAKLYFDIVSFFQSLPDLKQYENVFLAACNILILDHLPRMKPLLESRVHASSEEFLREFHWYMACKKSKFSEYVFAMM